MQVVCHHCGRSTEFSSSRPKFCSDCGAPLPSPALDETVDYEASTPGAPMHAPTEDIPERIGEFRVIRRLGGGGMGVVYEAESPGGQRVALKLMRPEVQHSPATEERFRQEGRLASGIAHPRCVFVHGVDQEVDRPYIVMELTSGETLKDLVERRGPLEPLDAVAKIIDVIDGLREAHALGVIHRDVKPSNCFLEADGRVKVGDFGLSRSLQSPSHLTQTGGFLGTVLFAPPEQHKGERVDVRTDVYSVCATLFYLLTGRAPFEDSQGSAAIARIVTEPAPAVSQFRSGVPKPLERIIARGLERFPERRFQTLDDLRAELAVILPDRLSLAGVATRAAAYIFDAYVAQLGLGLLFLSMLWYGAPRIGEYIEHSQGFLQIVLPILYFWLFESTWGASPGKMLLRLRVVDAASVHPLSWKAVLLRTAAFIILHEGLAEFVSSFQSADASDSKEGMLHVFIWIGALLLLMSTMRKSNGFRMLHDVLARARVVQLPWPRATPTLKVRPLEDRPVQPLGDDVPKKLGRFALRGTLLIRDGDRFFLGEDVELERRAVLWLRRGSPLSDVRRRNARTTRFRWLEGGLEGEFAWDAFLTPRGSPLPEVAADNGRLDWSAVRQMLEDLAEELEADVAEGSTPTQLQPNDVFMQSNGRVQIAEWPHENTDGGGSKDDDPRLGLIRRCAVLALEGKPRNESEESTPIRAVLPLHARSILNRLVGAKEPILHRMIGGKRPYDSVASLHEDLVATKNLPVRVNLPLRVLQVGQMALGLGLVLIILLSATRARAYHELTTLKIMVDRQVWTALLNLKDMALEQLPANHPMKADPNRMAAAVERRIAMDRDRMKFIRAHLGPLGRALVHARGALEEHAEFNSHTSISTESNRPTADSPLLFIEYESSDYGRAFAFEVTEDDIVPIRGTNNKYGFDPDAAKFMPLYLAIAVLLLWILWGAIFRGGVSYRLANIALVRSNGRKALRIQVVFRAILFWLPIVATVAAACWVDALNPEHPWLCETINWCTILLLAAYAVAVFRSPEGHWHDRLSGVHLVTR